MGRIPVKRLPCERCGKVTKKNVRCKSLDNAYLCEKCKKSLLQYPFKYIPEVGELAYDENGGIICHVCGRGGFNKLSAHITQAHNMKAMEYREKFGLKRTQSLTAKDYHSGCSKRMKDLHKNTDILKETLDKHREKGLFKANHIANKNRVPSMQEVREREERRGKAIPINTIFRRKRNNALKEKRNLENQD